MNKKRQIVAIVSIVLLTLLIGTLFNMGFIVSGGKGGKKYEELQEAISELQSKVDSLNASLIELQDRVATIEEETTHVKTIRFYEPNETINNQPPTYKDGAIFVWTPNNSTNNAILSIRCYFQYHSEGSGTISIRIVINDETVMSYGELHGAEYRWMPIIGEFKRDQYPELFNTYPNQNNYTIKFQFGVEPIGYVKDINIIITVVDGLPAYNS